MKKEGKSAAEQAGLYLTYGIVGGMFLGVLIGAFMDRVALGISLGIFVGCLVSAVFIGRLDLAKKPDDSVKE